MTKASFLLLALAATLLAACGEAVAWADIADIAFTGFAGDLNDSGFCSELPDAVAADIHYRDGHRDRKNLIDTTDEGMEGLSERGEISTPIRNVARLRVIDRQSWDWVKKYQTDPLERDRARNALVLKVRTDEGNVIDMRSASFLVHREKNFGDRSLDLATTDNWDLRVFIAGTRVDLAWPDLKSVEMIDPDMLTARITYANGRSETVTIAQIKRIDVVKQVRNVSANWG